MSTVMCTRFLRTRNVAEARLWQKVIRVCTEGMNYQASVEIVFVKLCEM